MSPALLHEARCRIAEALGQDAPEESIRFLQRVTKTLSEENHGQSFSQWTRRYLSRQSTETWRQRGDLQEALVTLQMKAYAADYKEGKTQSLPLGLDDVSSALWVLDRSAPQARTILQAGCGLVFGGGNRARLEGKDAPLSGSSLAEIKVVQALVQVTQSSGDKERAWAVGLKGEIPDLFPGRSPAKIQIKSSLQSLSIAPMQKPAWASNIGRDGYGLFLEFEIKGVIQKMRWIPPTSFKMGSPESEPERNEDETQHEVILSQGYWLAETACTQALWEAVTGKNPSRFKGAERPVEQISWKDIQEEFLPRLNEALPGLAARLPTEAEWEMACRAGTKTPFSFGENITSDQVNYSGDALYAGGKEGKDRAETLEVKALPANQWGFYQMHGNVWEWCADWSGSYPSDLVTDPEGPKTGVRRVLRGGSWIDYGRRVRSAGRNDREPSDCFSDSGFRLARGQTRQRSECALPGETEAELKSSRQGACERTHRSSRHFRKLPAGIHRFPCHSRKLLAGTHPSLVIPVSFQRESSTSPVIPVCP